MVGEDVRVVRLCRLTGPACFALRCAALLLLRFALPCFVLSPSASGQARQYKNAAECNWAFEPNTKNNPSFSPEERAHGVERNVLNFIICAPLHTGCVCIVCVASVRFAGRKRKRKRPSVDCSLAELSSLHPLVSVGNAENV